MPLTTILYTEGDEGSSQQQCTAASLNTEVQIPFCKKKQKKNNLNSERLLIVSVVERVKL